MARDKLLIWNQALSHVGARNAVQDADEATREAQHLSAIWEICRDEVMEAIDWGFLTTYRTLSALSEDPPESWDYVYQWPSDCLKFRFIEPVYSRTDEAIPYEIGNSEGDAKVIWTDQEDAVGCYSKSSVTNPELWSAAFCSALSWKLSVSLAMTEIGSVRDSVAMSRVYERQLVVAAVQSANQKQRDPLADCEGIAARQ